MSDNNIHINDIVITPQLLNRGYRNRNADLEKRAFQELARQIPNGRQAVLDAFCDAALSLCEADAAGVSVLHAADGDDAFTWDAIAGSLASFKGGKARRHHSPCGYSLERNSAQLYSYPERYYEWLRAVDHPIVEGLIVPLYGEDRQAIGTIWAVSHQERRRFDRHDLQVLSVYASHTSAALRMHELY